MRGFRADQFAGWSILLLVATAVAADRPLPTKPSANQPRTWTDRSGKYRIRATLLEVEEASVRLKKVDGTMIHVPLERLSEADQEWVAKQPTGLGEDDVESGGGWPGWRSPGESCM